MPHGPSTSEGPRPTRATNPNHSTRGLRQHGDLGRGGSGSARAQAVDNLEGSWGSKHGVARRRE
eukprot:11540509-Alexandrium_andersonii.AAC.1